MACQGCTNEAHPAATSHAAAFDRVFDRFWPASLPFPPAAPYLAAAVGRAEARQWATDIGADRDPGVLSGDPIALLDMVGRAMMDPAEAFAGKRKKKKKKRKNKPGSNLYPECSFVCMDGSSLSITCPEGEACEADLVACRAWCTPWPGSADDGFMPSETVGP